MPPLRRWQEGMPVPLPLPSPAQLREAFLWSEHLQRDEDRDGLHGNTYQVDQLLAGRKVQLVFDPFDLTAIEVRHRGQPFGTAGAVHDRTALPPEGEARATRPRPPSRPGSATST